MVYDQNKQQEFTDDSKCGNKTATILQFNCADQSTTSDDGQQNSQQTLKTVNWKTSRRLKTLETEHLSYSFFSPDTWTS